MTAQDRDRTLRILTLILVAVWVATLVIRIGNPAFALGPAVDSLMVTATGYWFSKEGLKKGST